MLDFTISLPLAERNAIVYNLTPVGQEGQWKLSGMDCHVFE
jgi:hypothetical protein